MTGSNQRPKIGVIVAAHNASATLAAVLNRIPDAIWTDVDSVLICDDHSDDETYELALRYQRTKPELPVVVTRRDADLGYGGNQKAAYRWAIDQQLDIVVLLHGDGRYAPECMGDLIAPLVSGEADVVLGSRMLIRGAARRGGMPIYRQVGNWILTTIANRSVGLNLSEWHSGYRAYKVDALNAVPFESNSDGFDFDVQLTIQIHEAGLRMFEVPIPTYYGKESCDVKGLEYARDVVSDVLRYRLHKMGFGSGNLAFGETSYQVKLEANSSHTRVLSWMSERPPQKILDIGCADGALGALLKRSGHHVTGLDINVHDGVDEALDHFIATDLENGLASAAGSVYDVVIAADVVEHVRRPDVLLREVEGCLAPGGTLIASVPNFSHWYPRLRVVSGRFDYDRRGILDRTHLRFFTRRSFDRLAHEAGFMILRCEAIGVPFEAVGGRGGSKPAHGHDRQARTLLGLISRLNRWTATNWPNLFAYQYIYELAPQHSI
jgi:glycosyltransferase involved in cell wall biosynthesis